MRLHTGRASFLVWARYQPENEQQRANWLTTAAHFPGWSYISSPSSPFWSDVPAHPLSLITRVGLSCMSCNVRDLWAQKDLGSFNSTYSASVDSHDAAFLVISP